MTLSQLTITNHALVGAISFSGCASSSPSWEVLGKQGVDSNMCSLKLKDQSEIEKCNIKQLAAIRAKEECQKDINPGYCVDGKQNHENWNNVLNYNNTLEKNI